MHDAVRHPFSTMVLCHIGVLRMVPWDVTGIWKRVSYQGHWGCVPPIGSIVCLINCQKNWWGVLTVLESCQCCCEMKRITARDHASRAHLVSCTNMASSRLMELLTWFLLHFSIFLAPHNSQELSLLLFWSGDPTALRGIWLCLCNTRSRSRFLSLSHATLWGTTKTALSTSVIDHSLALMVLCFLPPVLMIVG